MRSRVPAKSGPYPLTLAVVGFFVLLIGAIGTVAVLAYFGVVDINAWLGRKPKNPYAGMVAIPVSCREIPAHSRVEREDLADMPHNRPILYIYSKPNELDPRWITNYSKIVGRVLVRDKKAGMVFSEADFAPAGTRPGLAAGIPINKRAMVLDAMQIRGLDELRIGDHFDLVSSEPVDMQGIEPQARAGTGSRGLVKGMGAGGSGKKTRVAVLVEDGVVVTRPAPAPAMQPRSNSAMSQLTGADAAANRKGPREMAVAVSPEEVTSLSEALSAKKSIYCLARSGLPDEKFDHTQIPEEDPLKNVSMIETIHGKKFGMEAFTASDGTPLAPASPDKPTAAAGTPSAPPGKATIAPAAHDKSRAPAASAPPTAPATTQPKQAMPADEPEIGLPPGDPDD